MTYRHFFTQRGMTLVEIMVAITISLVLLSGVMQIFLSSKQTYRMNEELGRLLLNHRLEDVFEKIKNIAEFTEDAILRILGARPGSINLAELLIKSLQENQYE